MLNIVKWRQNSSKTHLIKAYCVYILYPYKMIKRLTLILTLATFFIQAGAQTLKPDVLVIGNGNAAVAAGLQSAISGVKTTILLQAGGFDISPISGNLSSGIEATFLKKIIAAKQIQDSTETPVFNKQMANDVLTTWAESLKNLTIIKNTLWVKADRAGKNWSFKLSDGRSIRPKILINPADSKLNDALKITASSTNSWTKLDYNNTIYRTSISAGKLANGTVGNIFSMYQLLVPLQENLVWVNDAQSMLLGQAAGATAAYAAFFDTKTSLSNVKTIQGELVNYKLAIVPYIDIQQPDTNWKAIQMVGLTGVIKGEIEENTIKFLPNKGVSTEEIKQPLKDFYYKAQIWFDDYKSPQMTIGSTIDMICYVGNKSIENTKKELAKKWKTTYQFKTDLDLNREINRREFAVLLQDYMPPFNVNIDPSGKVVR